ncbi:hypothetical protein [Methylocystis echinoides]|jgi:hypothetical protein|uniref:hypothetical protein n=1 Tax=Methylocystis echinoides TaxID=29468 RepID=UPI0034428310
MHALLKFSIVVAIVICAANFGFGVEFVIALSAAISVYMLWVSRLRPELMLYFADLPNNLLYWICVGFPVGLVIRTLALSLVLVPIYVLSP